MGLIAQSNTHALFLKYGSRERYYWPFIAKKNTKKLKGTTKGRRW